MNKITFLLLTAGLAVTSYAAEFSEESIEKANLTGDESFWNRQERPIIILILIKNLC